MQNSWRNNKTQKKQADISGNTPLGWKGPTSEALESFLNSGANDAYKRPWHRLERGIRLNRISLFVEEEKQRIGLSDMDSRDLSSLLTKSLDKKLLNSKSNVNYDPDKERIMEIKGLVMHRTAEGRNLFQIMERKSASVTFRKPRTTSPQPSSAVTAVTAPTTTPVHTT
jgi:hypothetical protein